MQYFPKLWCRQVSNKILKGTPLVQTYPLLMYFPSQHLLKQKKGKGLSPIYDKSVQEYICQNKTQSKIFGMNYPCNIIFPMIHLSFIRTSINTHQDNTFSTLIFMPSWIHLFCPNKTKKKFARGYPLFARTLQFNIPIS